MVKPKSNMILITGIVCSISFVLIALFIAIYNEGFSIDFNKNNVRYTDIMMPLIMISSVLVTGLAFYAQIEANKEVKEQFELQQFETHFFEMLKIHKDNYTSLSRIEFNNKERYNVSSKELFDSIIREFELILEINQKIKIKSKLNPLMNEDIFIDLFKILYFGIDYFKHTEMNEIIQDDPYYELYKEIKNDISHYVLLEGAGGLKGKLNYIPFKGHYKNLDTYLRHLFHLVDYVANEKVKLSHNSKMKYLKMLRSQLSINEQTFLYYFWLSGIGKEWENDKNKFFTEFLMIRDVMIGSTFSREIIPLWYSFINKKLKALYDTKTLNHNESILIHEPPTY